MEKAFGRSMVSVVDDMQKGSTMVLWFAAILHLCIVVLCFDPISSLTRESHDTINWLSDHTPYPSLEPSIQERNLLRRPSVVFLVGDLHIIVSIIPQNNSNPPTVPFQ